MTDGIYTLPSDKKHYAWRKMIEKVKELGRPLTAEEYERYKIATYIKGDLISQAS